MADCPSAAWNALLEQSGSPTFFMRHEYLNAMEQSQSACADTGWQAHHVSLWLGQDMVAACPLYLKNHSYGEYVFDWAWARAHEHHGLAYYPKALVAVPFTPVPGSRLLATSDEHRLALGRALPEVLQGLGISSIHLLFGDHADSAVLAQAGWLERQQTQFHWTHQGWSGFDDFLKSLNQEKRKKIRQERERVKAQGVHFTTLEGLAITPAWWDFFYRCYAQTYWEHGNPPYLSHDFFDQHAKQCPEHWVMFVAWRNQQAIACSLVGIDPNHVQAKVAYGRYWGAIERVNCLHFEACYYQPIEWCIHHGVQRFEGGAQGEHKLARALMPVTTSSWHWVSDPRFRRAIADYAQREVAANQAHEAELIGRSPFRQSSGV